MKKLYLLPFAATATLLASTAHSQAAVSYTSPIEGYQAFTDEKVSSWKAANDKVGQIGGWRAYAKEANQPENTPTLAPKAASMQKNMAEDEAMKKYPQAGQKP